MPDWKATRYRKTAVVFEERTYFVASRTALSGGVWRYVLAPWPDDLHDAPGRTIHYGEPYVLERDQTRREQGRLERKAVGLYFLTWLLGFLPSGVKLRLNERYGIHPLVVTGKSLFLEYLAFINLVVLLVIGGFTGALPILPLLGAAAVVAIDRTVRTARLEKGGMRQYGFGEWIFRRIRDEDDF